MFIIEIKEYDKTSITIQGNLLIECNVVRLFPDEGGILEFKLIDIEFIKFFPE